MAGRYVTKIRNRLKPSKEKHLVVSTENRTKFERLFESCSYKLTEEDNGFETVTLKFGPALVEEVEGSRNL